MRPPRKSALAPCVDPRVVSRTNGEVFASLEALQAARPDDGPATEVLHFAIGSPRSPYGIPRCIGALLAVLGSRQMEEVNYLYFENKSVPPLALLVSGGKLSDTSIPRIERIIEENLTPGIVRVTLGRDKTAVPYRVRRAPARSSHSACILTSRS